MSLPKANLFLPVGGLRGEVDDRLLPAGSLIELENAYLPKAGRAEKRFGTTPLPAPAATPYALAVHKKALVALIGDGSDPLEVLPDASATGWIKGTNAGGPIIGAAGKTVTAALTRVATTTPMHLGTMTVADVAYGNGYYFAAYLDGASNRTIHLTAIESTTGHIVADHTTQIIGVDIAAWRVRFTGGHAICAFATTAGAINFLAMDPASGFAVNTTNAGVVATMPSYNLSRFDMYVKDSTTVSVVYPATVGSIVARCLDFTPSPASVTAWAPKDSAGADISVELAAAWMEDFGGSGKVALMSSALGGAGLKVHWDVPTAGATRQAASTYTFGPGNDAQELAGHTTGNSATGEFVVVYGSPASTFGSIDALTGMVSRLGGVLTSAPVLYRGANLRSKTFTYGGEYYAVVSYAGTANGTHYLVKIPTTTTSPTLAAPLAQFAIRQGPGSMFSCVASPATGIFTVAMTYTIRFDGGDNRDVFGVQLATITFPGVPATTLGPPREAVESLFIPGGVLKKFDGITLGEANFAYRPQLVSLVPGAAVSGLTPESDYWYAWVYSALDAQGRIWRSAPTPAQMVHTGAGQRQVTATVSALRLTGLTNVQAELYRGVAGDAEVLQKVGVVANSIIVDTLQIVDTVTDAVAATGEFLYTTDGFLPNQTPPGFSALAVAQNRLWGISQDDPQVLWFTKEFTLDQGLAWSEALALDVRDEHGPMRGITVVDDKVVVFKDRMTYVIIGVGPDGRGENSTYKPQVVTPGVGCPSPQGICEYRDGIMFSTGNARSPFASLDRGLTLHPIGGLQRYSGLTVVGTIYVPSLSQVRFYTTAGTTLVYDVTNAQASVFTGQPAYCAVSWQGVPVYANSTASLPLIEQMNGSTYTENGGAYQMTVAFPWIQVNQIKGYERFWRVQPVGSLMGEQQDLTVQLYRDFSTVAFHTVAEEVGTADINVEARYSTKLSAIRVRLFDAAAGDAGFAINGITVQVAAKQGMKRNVARMT